jgi:signal peptidase I
MDTETLKPTTNPSGNGKIKEIIYFILTVIIIVVPIRTFIAQPFVVSGDSMLPTFHTGEYLIVDQITYKFSEPERGDVIIFKFPNDHKRFFIKRIIGLPGETVELTGQDITIINEENPEGFTLSEPHIVLQKDNAPSQITLGEEEYFAIGDNRTASFDSRAWGSLKKDLIIGRAFLRLIPIAGQNYLPGKVDYTI